MKRRLLAIAFVCALAVSALAGGPEVPPAPDPPTASSTAAASSTLVDVLLSLLIASFPK